MKAITKHINVTVEKVILSDDKFINKGNDSLQRQKFDNRFRSSINLSSHVLRSSYKLIHC